MNLEMHPTMVDPVETAEEPTSSLSLSSPTSNLATQSNIRLNRDLSRLLPLVSVRRPSQGSAQPILSLASRFLQKATTPLQLPSYERLGISSSSSPTTDSSLRPCSADCSVPKPGSSFVSNLSSQAHTVHTRSYSASETDDSLPPLGAYQQSLPLTPPADYDERHLDWNPTSSFPAIEVCKSKHNYPPQVLLDENNYNTRTSSPGGRGSSDSSGNSDSISAAMSSNPTSMMQNLHIHQSQHEKGNWLEDIIETMCKFGFTVSWNFLFFPVVLLPGILRIILLPIFFQLLMEFIHLHADFTDRNYSSIMFGGVKRRGRPSQAGRSYASIPSFTASGRKNADVEYSISAHRRSYSEPLAARTIALY